MAAHRYWRLNITEHTGDPNELAITELEFRTSIGGADVCSGGTASASAVAGGSWSADKAFDNSTSTFWYTGTVSGTHWIKYDFGLGNDKDIVEVGIRPQGYINAPRDFALQYSDNDSTWTTLFAVNGETDISNTAFKSYSANSLYDSGASGRFWRVNCTAAVSDSLLAAAEIQMFVAGSATNQCTGGEVFSSSRPNGAGFNDTLAFDGSLTPSSFWSSYATLPTTAVWIGYKFASAKSIVCVAITGRDNTVSAPKDFTIQYWNGSSFTTYATLTGITGWTSGQTRYFYSTGEAGGPPSSAIARPVVFVCT